LTQALLETGRKKEKLHLARDYGAEEATFIGEEKGKKDPGEKKGWVGLFGALGNMGKWATLLETEFSPIIHTHGPWKGTVGREEQNRGRW